MTAYTVKHTKTGLLVIHDIDMRQRHAVLLVNSYPARGEKKKPRPTRRNGREELGGCLCLLCTARARGSDPRGDRGAPEAKSAEERPPNYCMAKRGDPKHSFLSSSFDPEAVLTAETVSVPFSDVAPLDNLSACRRLLPPSAKDYLRPEDDHTLRAGSHHSNAAKACAQDGAGTVTVAQATDASESSAPSTSAAAAASSSQLLPPLQQRRPRLSALFHRSVAESGSGPLGGASSHTDEPDQRPLLTAVALTDAPRLRPLASQCSGPFATSACASWCIAAAVCAASWRAGCSCTTST